MARFSRRRSWAIELYLESNRFKLRGDMNTINTATVVQHGRITVNVPD